MQQLHVALQVQNLLLQVVGISIKLLTESHRHSILQLGATHLYCVVIFLSLIAESANQTSQSTYQVGTLTAVSVVVRRAILIFALFVAHDFERTVSDNLIDIHVNRSSGTTLNHVDREVLVPFSVNNFLASLNHSTCYFVADHAQRVVSLRSRHLH